MQLGVLLKFDPVFDLANEAFKMLGEAFDLFRVFMQQRMNLAVMIEMNEFEIGGLDGLLAALAGGEHGFDGMAGESGFHIEPATVNGSADGAGIG